MTNKVLLTCPVMHEAVESGQILSMAFSINNYVTSFNNLA